MPYWPNDFVNGIHPWYGFYRNLLVRVFRGLIDLDDLLDEKLFSSRLGANTPRKLLLLTICILTLPIPKVGLT